MDGLGSGGEGIVGIARGVGGNLIVGSANGQGVSMEFSRMSDENVTHFEQHLK